MTTTAKAELEPVGPDGPLTVGQLDALAALRRPFPDSAVGKLPKLWCAKCRNSTSKTCDDHDRITCKECNNSHSSATLHIDYVGHAAITDRLLTVDPAWHYTFPGGFVGGCPPIIEEPSRKIAVVWIELHVAGMTRPGVGTAPLGHEDREKILVGDAIRNAAMRFGCALDVWSKSPLESSIALDAIEEQPEPAPRVQPQRGRKVADLTADGTERTVDTATGEVTAVAAGDMGPMQALNQLPSRALSKVARQIRDAGVPWPLPAEWDELENPDLVRALIADAA